MIELPEFLRAVDQMAKEQSGGSTKVRQLLEEKFVVPTLSATKTNADWKRHRELFGEIEFRQLLHKMTEAKLRGLAKRLDKHASLTAETSTHEFRAHVEKLADGTVTPTSAPPKEKKKKEAATVPDLRAAYREGGNDRVFEVISALDAKTLKAAVATQNLKADISTGRGADGWRKFIQVALKDELGPRADAIGELSRLAPAADDD